MASGSYPNSNVFPPTAHLPSATRVSLQCVPGQAWIPNALFSPTYVIPQPPGGKAVLSAELLKSHAQSRESQWLNKYSCAAGFLVVCLGVMFVSLPLLCVEVLD